MADYTSYEEVTRRQVWAIPVRAPGRGCVIGEFLKALSAAEQAVTAARPDATRWDDWAYVDADDEHIRIVIEHRPERARP